MRTYIIDNDRQYSDHQVSFVEADPSVMLRIFELATKAWPRECQKCGQTGRGFCCHSTINHANCHFPFIIAEADSFEWRIGQPQSLATWLEDLASSMNYERARDATAAKELRQLVLELRSDIWIEEDFD